MYKALQVEFISKKKNAHYASNNGIYIKRDKVRIKMIVLDLHDVISDSRKAVFASFKIGKLFSVKDPIPGRLRSRVVYTFACAGCNACYVGETTRHFAKSVREHLFNSILNIAALCQ